MTTYPAGRGEHVSYEEILPGRNAEAEDLPVRHGDTQQALKATVPHSAFGWRCGMQFGKSVQSLLEKYKMKHGRIKEETIYNFVFHLIS